MKNININDEVYFMFKDRIQSAEVICKTTVEKENTSQFGGVPEVRITIEINKNPCGTQYTKMFDIKEVFTTKEDLIQSLREAKS
jgi:hypothetical protein